MSQDDNRQRPTVTRGRRARRDRAGSELYKPSSTARTSSTDPVASRSAASEHYHREKARRANRDRPDDHPMEQARRAYQELLASDAAKMRGGRPKKMVTGKPKSARSIDEADDL